MIFHPGIIALVTGSTLVILLLLYTSILGVSIILRWDFQSSSSYQLSLERKTYLISTIMNYVLGFQIISTLLFIYTVDDIHKLFVGAMCATGSLNANPIGWQALFSKIIVCFAAGFWIVLNYLDQTAKDLPLVRLKYFFLIILLPLILADTILQLVYFLGLDPEIITSCCGSLFSQSSQGVASSLSGLPVLSSMVVFYSATVIMLILSFLCLYSRKVFFRYLFSLMATVFLFVAMAGVVSFISIYIYELPSHHCPFDIFQDHYRFIGYPIYTSLFCGAFFGILPGLFTPLKRIGSLRENIQHIERSWIYISMGSVLIFALIATYEVAASNLRYF